MRACRSMRLVSDDQCFHSRKATLFTDTQAIRQMHDQRLVDSLWEDCKLRPRDSSSQEAMTAHRTSSLDTRSRL